MFSALKKAPPVPVCTAIIVAAGSGARMGTETKKQFLYILDKPVLAHTIEAIESCELVRDIIIVTASEDIITVKEIIDEIESEKVSEIVSGGEKRAVSVSLGLKAVKNDSDIVLIHDGVRPVLTSDLIERVISDASEYGAAALGVLVKDTMKTVDNSGFIDKTLNRAELVAIQTPQCFKTEIIKKAYENFDENATDDCALVESLGVKIKITEGSYSNLKLTTIEDLKILEALIINSYERED